MKSEREKSKNISVVSLFASLFPFKELVNEQKSLLARAPPLLTSREQASLHSSSP